MGEKETQDVFTIVQDTREKANKHGYKEVYFERRGYPIIRSKLFVGDYTRLDDQTVAIDTKKDLLELAGNICGKAHGRFREECERAKRYNISLIVLVEEEVPDLDLWVSPKRKNGSLLTNVKGGTLKRAMTTMTERYGVKFEFVKREQSGENIARLLSKKRGEK